MHTFVSRASTCTGCVAASTRSRTIARDDKTYLDVIERPLSEELHFLNSRHDSRALRRGGWDARGSAFR
ncbi:hypothetical protein BE221DRAFT_204855 [Ostreococcus tauri]|uniref:Uncharacterized protein n=1 Tax=Ostreococcus tauri TaxID=70448 RepID=A0A1Y5IDI0_OSTTA|nr:hypothetical protein BE221DRAFT_204855 [Ostreococcus tauri]